MKTETEKILSLCDNLKNGKTIIFETLESLLLTINCRIEDLNHENIFVVINKKKNIFKLKIKATSTIL